jgi:hypothetical protein
LQNVRTADGSHPWRIRWKLPDAYFFSAWSPGNAGERVLLGDGWGQRDWKNSDRGATLPYIIRRLTGDEASIFVSVFEGGKQGKEWVRAVRLLRVAGDLAALPVAVEVEGAEGSDVLFSAIEAKPFVVETSAGKLEVNGLAARMELRGGKVTGGTLVGGTSLKLGSFTLTSPAAVYRGMVQSLKATKDDGWYEVSGDLPAFSVEARQTLFVDDGKQRRAFPILFTEKTPTGSRVHVKSRYSGFDPLPAETWEVWARVDSP